MVTVHRNGRRIRWLTEQETEGIKRLRVAFYVRVSTEEQADRETPRNQIESMQRKFRDNFEDDALEPWVNVGTFSDEGVSGTVAFDKRPEGKRLLDLAAAGGVDLVVFFKLDRFGRKVTVIYDAYEAFEKTNVAIMSATEPWETRTPTGRLIFGLLAVLAEFERELIKERTSLGRDRLTRDGKYVNGVVPLGYEVVDKITVPSARIVPELQITEADLVRLIFGKVAGEVDGVACKPETTVAIANWLNALGVPSTKVWYTKDGRRVEKKGKMWIQNRISRMLHNPLYYGERTMFHKSGDIEQSLPPLISRQLFERAEKNLGNISAKGWRAESATQPKYTYLLSGRVFCGACEPMQPMQGNIQHQRPGKRRTAALYYGCARMPGKRGAKIHGACPGYGYVDGFQLEGLVVESIDRFMADPQAALDAWRADLRERHGESAVQMPLRERMQQRLGELEASKATVLHYVRTQRITEKEADREFELIGREISSLRSQVERVDRQVTLAEHMEIQLRDVASNLERTRLAWATARQTNDREKLREVISNFLGSATVDADGNCHFVWMGNVSSMLSTKLKNLVDNTDGLRTLGRVSKSGGPRRQAA